MRFSPIAACLLAVACSSDSGSSFGSKETWDVVTGESVGVVHLDTDSIDFSIGEFSGDLAIDADDLLKLTLRDEHGATRFKGRRTDATSLDLGITSLSIGGTWTLDAVDDDVDSHLRLSASEDDVALSCDGDCQDFGGLLSATRGESGSGDFGDVNGSWTGRSGETRDRLTVRLEDSKITITSGDDDVVSLRWSGDEMSGSLGQGDGEFSAMRR